MSNYAEMAKAAEKKGTSRELTHDIKTWHEAGDKIIGKVLDIIPFTGSKYETEAKQYIIETDEGLVSTVLGAGTDKQIAPSVKPGTVVVIEFKGKFELPDGRPCNKFKVQIIENA